MKGRWQRHGWIRRWFASWCHPLRNSAVREQDLRLASIASNASILSMSTTLTIRNLDEGVKQKLRMQAARNQRSMEAEARELLAVALEEQQPLAPPRTVEEMKERLLAVRGIWKDRAKGRSTDEIMNELRGDD